MLRGRRRSFWTWVTFGVVLIALGVASLGLAFVNRDYVESPVEVYTDGGSILMGPPLFGGDANSCYDCVDPTPWYAAGGALLFIALLSLVVAHRYGRAGSGRSAD